MARVNYKIAHLIHIDADEAKKEILKSLRANEMHMGRTATAIGCTHGTLLLWLKKLNIVEEVEKLREREIERLRKLSKKSGSPDPRFGGRPRMTDEEKKVSRAAREAMTPAQVAAATRARNKRHEERERMMAERARKSRASARAA